MKVILLGAGQECQRVSEWITDRKHLIVGMAGDDIVEKIARKSNIAYYNIQDIDEKKLKELSPDVIISYLFDKKIKEPLISFPKYGCINFHPALLPEYRGRGGCNFAILEKAAIWGSTAHYVDADFDTGAIIRSFKFSFDYRFETAISLKKKTLTAMYELMKSVLADIEENGKLPALKQDNMNGRYYSRDLMLQCMKIDLDNDDIDTKIQAFWYPPYDGAYIEINGKRYTLVNQFILKNLKSHQ